MIKTFGEFVNSELDEFYEDLKTSQKRIKLFCEFVSELDSIDTTINNEMELKPPTKKFQPKTKTYKPRKITRDKSNNVF